MRLFKGLAAGIAIGLFALSVAARAEGARTLKIIIPFPAGGAADIWGRLLGEQIGRAHGVTVLVENRPGAGTVIATEAVSRAPADGGTVLLVGNSFTINPSLRRLTYDPVTSFEPICHLLNSPQLIAVSSASPYRNLGDLVMAAKARPGELTLAVNGPATAQHLTGELFKSVAGIDLTYVPYPGGAPAVNALLGQHVTSVIANYSELIEHMKAGKLRALAATSRTRIEPLPDLPTVAEQGYKDFDMRVWFGIVAPAGTPKETAAQLADWFTAALQEPDIRAKLVRIGLYPVHVCGADFGAYIRAQVEENARIIRDANIRWE
jgi:tripartite-type tricarboxylate transporter receptor subunit TctC